MDLNSELLTIIASVAAALTSTKAWDFWKSRQRLKQKKDQIDKEDLHLYRDDLRKEVSRLRTELMGLHEKRDLELKELRSEISELKEQLSAFKVRVEFLEKELEVVEKENENLKQKLTVA